MTYQPEFFILLAIAALGIVLAVIGIRRGKAVTIFKHSRAVSPGMFWWSVMAQLGISIMCLASAATMIFKR